MMMLSILLLAAAAPQAAADPTSPTALRTADARLNAQYRATMAKMKARDAVKQPDAQNGPSYQQALVSAQRAWIAFRDSNCLAFSYEFRGGSAARQSAGTCLIRMTKARTDELRLLSQVLTPL